jgi:hypothetical protein
VSALPPLVVHSSHDVAIPGACLHPLILYVNLPIALAASPYEAPFTLERYKLKLTTFKPVRALAAQVSEPDGAVEDVTVRITLTVLLAPPQVKLRCPM